MPRGESDKLERQNDRPRTDPSLQTSTRMVTAEAALVVSPVCWGQRSLPNAAVVWDGRSTLVATG